MNKQNSYSLHLIKQPRNINIVFPEDFCPDENSDVIELPATYVWKKNQLIYIFPKPDKVFNVDLAKEQSRVVSDLFMLTGKKYALICDVRKAKQIDNETRDFYSSEEASKDLFAFVFVVDSIFSQLIANFFVNLKTMPIPVRMFNKISKAENWLNDLKISQD